MKQKRNKLRRKLLSFLLTLALVLGLMPEMSLTAYAATSHGITINSAQHGTVTASVNGSAATSAEEGATVTLTANPDNGYRLKSISGTYKGNPQEKKGLNGTRTINGTYFNLNATDAAGAGWKLANNSTITITSKDTSVKIDKVDFNISQRGNSFNLNNVSCSAGTKSLNGNTLSVSSINGTTVTLSSGANNAGYVRFNSVTIYGTGAVDTNLSISTTGDVNVRTFTMPAVAEGNVIITAEFEEIPKYSVTLTGGANATTSGGATTQSDLTGAMTTVTYTANTGYYFAEFTDITNNGIIAKRTNETTVTVSGTPLANVSITIPDAMKQVQTITASDVTAIYGDTDKSVSATTDGNGEISYAVKAGSEDYISVASDGKLTIKKVPADGKAYVTVTASETNTGGTDGNGYAAATKDVTVNISKATVTITAKDQSIYVGGTVPTLSGADFYTVTGLVGEDALTTNPTLAYQNNGSAATPDNTTAGIYDIVASGASAGDNYAISYTKGTLTISEKQPATVTKAPEAKTLTYTGSAQALVTAGEATGGTMQYALGTATEATEPYTTSIPTKSDAGTYYVWYKVIGDSDHLDTLPMCVEAVISDAPDDEGNINVETRTEEGAPDCGLEVPDDTLDSLLTEEEKERLNNGEAVLFYLDVSNTDPSETDKSLIESKLKEISSDAQVGMFFDMSFYKQVGNDPEPEKITDLNGKKVNVLIDVPKELQNAESGKTRIFYVVRIHNGVAEIIAESTKTPIPVESDKFSTYAILYEDVEKSTGSSYEHHHHICEHGHIFNYHVFQEPTTETDGYAGWVCDRCGIQDPDHADYVGPTGYIVLSAFPVFNDTLEKNIAAAPENGTVSISTKRWMSVRRGVLEALAARPDVTLSISFVYEGSEYELTMKGSDPVLAEYLASGDLFFGFIYLGDRFGLGTKAAETTTP